MALIYQARTKAHRVKLCQDRKMVEAGQLSFKKLIYNLSLFRLLMSRKNYHRSIESQNSRLRMSTNFLNSEILRGSLTPNFNLCKLRNSNIDRVYEYQRVSSLNKKGQRTVEESDYSNHSYAHLKDTLSELQLKIKKAQQILKKTGKSNPISTQQLLDYQQTISEIQSNKTKKIDYSYNSLTENSTKLLSFVKSESSLEIPKSRKRRENSYYIGNIYDIADDQRIEEHLLFSFKTFKTFAKFQAMPSSEFEDSWNLPVAPHNKGKKTILLDIDQTILHCEQYPIKGQVYDLQLQVAISQTEHATAYISLRPYALTFLKNIAKVFEIIAFTASHESYADVVLNQLDPDGQIFSHRLYRSSCQQLTPTIFAKDIRVLNRKPENMVLIDNSPYSYIFQLQNGIPILPYRYQMDKELPRLQKYLYQVNKAKDVRQINKSTFLFHRYTEFKNLKELIENLYVNPN